MSENKAVQYYASIQEFLGLACDKDGYTWGQPRDIKDPEAGVRQVIVREAEKRKLALPTDHWLEDPDHDKYVTFHPLCESALCAESPVIDFLREWFGYVLGERATCLAAELIRLGVDKNLQSQFSSAQAKIIAAAVGDTRKVTIKEFDALCASGHINVRQLFSFYVKRSGTFMGEPVMRMCTVRSPLLSTFSDKYKTINDSEAQTERTYTNTKKVLTYLCGPAIDKDFDHGSNNPVAPYFDALVQSAVKVQDHLNEIASTMKEYLEDYDFIYMSTKEIKRNKDYRQLAGMIPVMPFNSGAELSRGGVDDASPALARSQSSSSNDDWNKAANPATSNQSKDLGLEEKIKLIQNDESMSNYERTLLIKELEQEASYAASNPQGFVSREQQARNNNDPWSNATNDAWGNNNGWNSNNNNNGGWNNGGWGGNNQPTGLTGNGNPNWRGR